MERSTVVALSVAATALLAAADDTPKEALPGARNYTRVDAVVWRAHCSRCW